MIVGLDANCFKRLMDEHIDGATGTLREIEEFIRENGYIPIDEEGITEQEWRDCTGAHANEFVESWLSDALIDGLIELRDEKPQTDCKRALRQVGVPSKDAKLISFHIAAPTNVYVSCDIDCHNPKLKNSSSTQKARAFASANAPVCKMVRKSFGLEIVHPDHWSFAS